MAVSEEALRAAIEGIAHIDGVVMPPEALVEDVVLLAEVWPDDNDFRAAVASCAQALAHIAAGRVTASALSDSLDGWFSYHFQLRRAQGEKAVLRIVYRPVRGGVEVKGFGHRFRPADFYHRIVRGEAIRL